jgi:hypothetical protein
VSAVEDAAQFSFENPAAPRFVFPPLLTSSPDPFLLLLGSLLQDVFSVTGRFPQV